MLWRTRYRLREFASGSLWPIPVLIVGLAVNLTDWTRLLDAEIADGASLDLSPGAATALLATIAGAMITFTGFVFSVLLLVVQFASGQFTPRVLRIAYRDRLTQVALGVFVGTFVYSLYVLEEVSATSVPEASLSIAVLLVLVSVILFISLISRVAGRLRAPRIADTVTKDGLKAIRAACARSQAGSGGPASGPDPGQVGAPGAPTQVVHVRRSGVVRAVNARGLARIARRHDAEIAMRRGIGDSISPAVPLFEVRGGTVPARSLRRAVMVREERATSYDPTFALRVLVDIANRALSPGVNDPTTALQVIDRIQTLLEEFSRRAIPSGVRRDGDGQVRFRRPVPTWEDIVELGVAEIQDYGSDSIQVARRVRAMLLDLLDLVPSERRAAVQERLARLERAIAEDIDDPGDRRLAAAADWQGMGLARHVTPSAVGGASPRADDG